MRSPLILLTLIFAAILLIFFPSLNYYFLQDDWFVLNKVLQQPLTSFFVPNSEIIYFRPLGMQTFFYFAHRLFNLDAFGYHLLVFSFHLLNTALIFYVLLKVAREKFASAFGAFVYGVSSVHFMSLSWLALSWNVFGMFFILLSFISYLNSKKIRTILFFLLAILTTEFASALPLFLIAFSYFFQKEKWQEVLKRWGVVVGIMLAIDAIYLYLRFVTFPVPASGEYQLQFNVQVIKTAFWYLLWLFNVPEYFKYQTALTQLNFSPILFRDATAFLWPTVISFVLTAAAFFFLVIKSRISRRVILGSVVIFFLFLLPVLFLPFHTYPYYLSLPLLGLVFLVSFTSSLRGAQRRSNLLSLPLIAFTIFWFYSSFLSVSLSRQTHWIPMEQQLAKEAIKKVNENSSGQPERIIFITTNEMLKQSLYDQEAMKVIFGRPVETFYTEDYETYKNTENSIIF